jgi:uncharacterized membrane protein YkvA (DUF1232 family)
VIRRFVGRQVLKRVSGGKFEQPNKMQALLRLPTLLRLTFALLRDNRVPVWQRAGVVGLIGLIVSPIDVIGDIPVIGQFWDLTLAVTVMDAFVQMAPAPVVNEHIAALGLERKIPLR